eukprot:Rhum_TRINITY_DN14249_c14_g1::Rhum_TRINITY_DN14249_c14_g1_i1::g.76946::m.76946/K14557/UTP6; U3 small nucleolar RNA-associated protein 6
MAAEAVHKAMEECVPAMEYYMARNVFSKDEVKEIIKRRTAMEYSLHGGAGSSPVEIMKAINYEKSLEVLRKRRSKKVVMRNRFNEHIQQRIAKLYERFQPSMRGEDRVDMAYDHVRWLGTLKKSKEAEKAMGQVLGRLVTEHPQREDIWVFCARWEMEHHNSIDNARALLQKGLRMVPQGKLLWRAYFMIELTYLGELLENLKSSPPAEGSDEPPLDANLKLILNGAIPKVVHSHCMAAFDDPTPPDADAVARDGVAPYEKQLQSARNTRAALTADFLRISRRFEFTAGLQSFLCSRLAASADAASGEPAAAAGSSPHAPRCAARTAAKLAGFYVASSNARLPFDYAGVAALRDESAEAGDEVLRRCVERRAADSAAAAGDEKKEEGEGEKEEGAASAVGTVALQSRGADELARALEEIAADGRAEDVLFAAAEAVAAAYGLEDKLRDASTTLGGYLCGAAAARALPLGAGAARVEHDLAAAEHPYVARVAGELRRLAADEAALRTLRPAALMELLRIVASLLPQSEAAGLAQGALSGAVERWGVSDPAQEVVDAHLSLAALQYSGGRAADAVATLKKGAAAAGAAAEAAALWVPAIQLAHASLGEQRAQKVDETVTAAVQQVAKLTLGAPRMEALEKVGTVALLAAPATALKALELVHKLPEALACQMVLACVGLSDDRATATSAPAAKRRRVGTGLVQGAQASEGVKRVRQVLDRLIKGPAGLGKSAQLWALWIRFEEANDVGKALHVRKCATRMPGGIQAHSLDAALKLVEAML